MSTTFDQKFDELENYKIQIHHTEISYFDLDCGFLKTTGKKETETILSYSSTDGYLEKHSFDQAFPYPAIWIDKDKQDSFRSCFPTLASVPLLMISDFMQEDQFPQFFQGKSQFFPLRQNH